MGQKPFKLDERDRNNFLKVCTTLYIITIYALMGVVSYRQFVLGQPHQEWDDIALIMTINIIVCIGAFLYISGGGSLRKIKLWHLVVSYGIFLLIGFGFTIYKYAVLLGQTLSREQIWGFFFTDLKISGILALALGALAYLGNRRIEKQIG